MRDLLLDFAPYGLTEEILDNLDNQLEIIEKFPVKDTETFSKNRDYANRDRMKAALLDKVRKMEVRVLAKYGKNSIEHEQFGMKGMARFSDEVLESKARAAYSFVNEKFSDLEQYGLTSALLTEFLDTINDFADARLTWLNSRSNILKATSRSTELSYEFYNELQKWMTIGRLIYRGQNKVLYDYFVTYGTKKSYKLVAPTNFAFDEATKKFSWETQPNVTSYQLQSSIDNENFVEIYSGEESEFVLSILPTVKTFYKVRPRNSKGFGEFSEVIVYVLL